MKIVFGTIFLVLGFQNVWADSLVNCKTTGKKPAPVIEYLVKSTKSQRLNSDITYYPNGTPTYISSDSVAQYGTASQALYLLIDNQQELPTMRLLAQAVKNGFNGKVENFDSSGKVIKTTLVNCTMAAF